MKKPGKKKLHQRLKHHLIPHKGNRYVPTIFSRESIAAIALTLLLIEGAYLFQTKVVMQQDGFTAAVLPTALTVLANADRGAGALEALVEDPLLARAAQAKADDMAARGYFAHVSPDGTTFRKYLDDAGYQYSYAGENLAVDFEESVDVERAWMNSPTHRANILKAEYTHVGYGVARGTYQGKDVTFVAQFFAAKSGASAPAREPQEVPAEEIASIGALENERVLGEQVQSGVSASESIAVMATSPSRALWYMVSAFTALVAVLYGLTVISHIRNKYLRLEVVGGGFLILFLGFSMLYASSGGGVLIPSASVSAAAQSQVANLAH